MGRLWRLSVVVLILTLAPMYRAWAECAWVLWLTAARPGEHATRPLEASRSLEECKKAMFSSDIRQMVQSRGADGATLTPRCLPDTIDPRGAKGGRR
jgi:hypothetical protein